MVRRGDYALEALLEQSVLCPSVRDDLSQRVATRGVCTRVLTGIYTESGLGEWCVREPGHSPVPRTAGRKSAAKISRGKSIYHRTPRTPLQERVLFFSSLFPSLFFLPFFLFPFFPFFLFFSLPASEPHRRIATTTTTIPPLTHSRYSQVSQYSDNKLHTAARDISPILTRKIELIDAPRVDATLYLGLTSALFFGARRNRAAVISPISFLAKEKKTKMGKGRTKSSVHLPFLLSLLLLLSSSLLLLLLLPSLST